MTNTPYFESDVLDVAVNDGVALVTLQLASPLSLRLDYHSPSITTRAQ